MTYGQWDDGSAAPDTDSLFELLAERLLVSRRICTCEFPGQGAYDCPAYDEARDGSPWTKPRWEEA